MNFRQKTFCFLKCVLNLDPGLVFRHIILCDTNFSYILYLKTEQAEVQTSDNNCSKFFWPEKVRDKLTWECTGLFFASVNFFWPNFSPIEAKEPGIQEQTWNEIRYDFIELCAWQLLLLSASSHFFSKILKTEMPKM